MERDLILVFKSNFVFENTTHVTFGRKITITTLLMSTFKAFPLLKSWFMLY